MFSYQNSIIENVRYLRNFAKKVIEERCLALQNGEETPNDILEHILKEAQDNPDVDIDDLVDNFLTIFVAGTSHFIPNGNQFITYLYA